LLRDLVAACRDAMIAAIQLLKFGFGEKWLRIILQNLCWPSGIVDAGECMLGLRWLVVKKGGFIRAILSLSLFTVNWNLPVHTFSVYSKLEFAVPVAAIEFYLDTRNTIKNHVLS
jgi:hypothetical protein